MWVLRTLMGPLEEQPGLFKAHINKTSLQVTILCGARQPSSFLRILVSRRQWWSLVSEVDTIAQWA